MVIHDKYGRVIHPTRTQRFGRFGMLASAALRALLWSGAGSI
jgi:hypothetical protein